MFAKTIIDSDAFLDMPLSTQCLYFHLSMRADDDGFLNNCKKIQRTVGASDDDLRLLMMKKFIIPFESGIVVIKHWKIHNYIQSDRYKPTVYQEEKAQLVMKKNRAYSLCTDEPPSTGREELPESAMKSGMDTRCIQDGYVLEAQNRLGKDRLEIESISSSLRSEDIGADAPTEQMPPAEPPKEPKTAKGAKTLKKEAARFVPPTLEEVAAYAASRHSRVDPQRFYEYFSTPDARGRTWRDSKGNPVRNWKQKFLTWEKYGSGGQGGGAWSGAPAAGGSGKPRQSWTELAAQMDAEEGQA